MLRGSEGGVSASLRAYQPAKVESSAQLVPATVGRVSKFCVYVLNAADGDRLPVGSGKPREQRRRANGEDRNFSKAVSQ